MKALAVNGSPRKKWSTAQLLQHALDGAAEVGAETELVHLYDLDYKGCTGCFSCKRIGGASYGACAIKDGLSPLLEKAMEADVLILGSPFYFYAETGEMRSFVERLLFPKYTYTPEATSLYEGRCRAAFIHTMGVDEEHMPLLGQDATAARTAGAVEKVLGHCESMLVTETLHFNDYSKYLATRWDPAVRFKRHEEVFPGELDRARELGARLAREAKGGS